MSPSRTRTITLEADTILGLLAEDVKAGVVSLGPRRKIWPKGPKHESAIFRFLIQSLTVQKQTIYPKQHACAPEVEPLMGKFAYKILIGAAMCVGHEATPSAVAEVREAVYVQGSTCRQRLREKRS